MRRLEHDGRSDARLESLLPASGDHAPAVARPESRKHPLWLRRYEIVSSRYGELEELLGHNGADDMEADVDTTCTAVAVAKEPGHRIEAAGLELATEDVHRLEATPNR